MTVRKVRSKSRFYNIMLIIPSPFAPLEWRVEWAWGRGGWLGEFRMVVRNSPTNLIVRIPDIHRDRTRALLAPFGLAWIIPQSELPPPRVLTKLHLTITKGRGEVLFTDRIPEEGAGEVAAQVLSKHLGAAFARSVVIAAFGGLGQ